MSHRAAASLTMLVLGSMGWAAPPDPCAAASSVSDVQFKLELKDGRAVFQEGEIIPLLLSFTSSAKQRYWAAARDYDRSGRLDIETYCVEPEAPDPLASYFKSGGYFGGGLGSERELDSSPFTATAELNEWRALAPGHYRVYAISHRVGRAPDASEQPASSRVEVVLRSNTVELDVNPPDSAWQDEQIESALSVLNSEPNADDARRAARKLRFLNTQESTRQLARLFVGLNQEQATVDLRLGLYGSPYRKLAIDSLHEQLAAPAHPINGEFLNALVNIEVNTEPAWDPASLDPNDTEAARTFWARRQAHVQELSRTEAQKVVAALSRKTGAAHTLTLSGLLASGATDQALAQTIRPALIAEWANLPAQTQNDIIEYRWASVAGPEMLPVLRRFLEQPPPPDRSAAASTRDAALEHLHELDPTEGRAAILREVLNPNAHPSLDVAALLPPEDIGKSLGPAAERIARMAARELDYRLIEKYAGRSELAAMQKAFEPNAGKLACTPQQSMLRYFLRVDPEYGAKEVSAALGLRSPTACFRFVLDSLGDEFPNAQASAIKAIDDSDSDLARNAAQALGHWGTADAEHALWARLRRFREEWSGRLGELRMVPDYQSPGTQALIFEQTLVAAIAQGRGWLCPPDNLQQLGETVLARSEGQQIETWIKQWKQGPATILTDWFPGQPPTFSVLQYISLTEDQLRAKIAQFPRGTELRWQFWQTGQSSPPVTMETQDALYEQMQGVAALNGVTLGKANHP